MARSRSRASYNISEIVTLEVIPVVGLYQLPNQLVRLNSRVPLDIVHALSENLRLDR